MVTLLVPTGSPLDRMREFAVLVLALGATHISLDTVAADAPIVCPYDRPFNLALCLLVLLSFSTLQVARSYGWGEAASWVVDAACFLPGLWWQMSTKESGWFAAVGAAEGCGVASSGHAMALWTLGELLTVAAALRLAARIGFGVHVFNTVTFLVAVTGVSFLMPVVARALNDAGA